MVRKLGSVDEARAVCHQVIRKINEKGFVLRIEDRYVFLSGPMSGYKNLNSSAFDAAEAKVKELGAKGVYNPCCLIEPYQAGAFSLEACRRQDIVGLINSDLVVLLPGWQLSSGALLERDIAKACGIELCELAQL